MNFLVLSSLHRPWTLLLMVTILRLLDSAFIRELPSNSFSWLSDVPEFLSPKVRLLLFTVVVLIILNLIIEFYNVELYARGYATRTFFAIVIALAIYAVFERISKKIRRNWKFLFGFGGLKFYSLSLGTPSPKPPVLLFHSWETYGFPYPFLPP